MEWDQYRCFIAGNYDSYSQVSIWGALECLPEAFKLPVLEMWHSSHPSRPAASHMLTIVDCITKALNVYERERMEQVNP